jgi:hypothetical protein
MDRLRQDLHFAFRTIRRAPGFSAMAILTLAVGIGAATVIGTAADRALIETVPYPAADRLVVAGSGNDSGGVGNVGFETALDWRARVRSFDQLAIIRRWQPTIVDEGRIGGSFAARPGAVASSAAGHQSLVSRSIRFMPDPSPGSIGACAPTRSARTSGIDHHAQRRPHSWRRIRDVRAGDLHYFSPAELGDCWVRVADVVVPVVPALEGDRPTTARRNDHGRGSRERADRAADRHPADYEKATPVVRALRDEIASPMRRLVLVGAVAFFARRPRERRGLLVARGDMSELAVRSAIGADRSALRQRHRVARDGGA